MTAAANGQELPLVCVTSQPSNVTKCRNKCTSANPTPAHLNQLWDSSQDIKLCSGWQKRMLGSEDLDKQASVLVAYYTDAAWQ